MAVQRARWGWKIKERTVGKCEIIEIAQLKNSEIPRAQPEPSQLGKAPVRDAKAPGRRYGRKYPHRVTQLPIPTVDMAERL